MGRVIDFRKRRIVADLRAAMADQTRPRAMRAHIEGGDLVLTFAHGDVVRLGPSDVRCWIVNLKQALALLDEGADQ